MNEAVQGSRVVWRYRLKRDKNDESAFALAYTTENGYSKSKDSNATQTKDGAVVTVSGGETTANVTSLYELGSEYIDKMEDAYDNNLRLQVWRIILDEPGVDTDADKCKATMFEGYLTTFEESDTSEDLVEYSLEFLLEGNGVKGYATVDDDGIISTYDFEDTVPAEDPEELVAVKES